MSVEIQGKLHRHRDRLKNRVQQMGVPDFFKRGQGFSEILVHPNSGEHCVPRRLNALAQGLPYAMVRENMLQTSVQLPSAQPVSFQDLSAGHSPSSVTLPKLRYLSSASTSIPKGDEPSTLPLGSK
ncbi:uncharacterized protein BO66DRAFT_389805 [Aspergillus aculeatinus CBS 121060]|uniref:Uncharacterized protein n=1 Tax=Aspergillus aculeatinus CBS 121060 TaxID=1448322 RepID=A0ACD1HGC2_9EURO|nr:hypothetical protein BO66DRAFT_389805 [Aspergillus aculeatinus CBS 121060]RAH72461.1 hypothetical protein BO66DRAFT_389805 [Aspergillus aculeatinus CBS 121060]